MNGICFFLNVVLNELHFAIQSSRLYESLIEPLLLDEINDLTEKYDTILPRKMQN